jgi:DNA-binding IclR family transcriptional regulator
MRRPRGEAADLILRALDAVGDVALTCSDLQERTSLSAATLQENLKALCKAGKVDTSRDGHGFVWVSRRTE